MLQKPNSIQIGQVIVKNINVFIAEIINKYMLFPMEQISVWETDTYQYDIVMSGYGGMAKCMWKIKSDEITPEKSLYDA